MDKSMKSLIMEKKKLKLKRRVRLSKNNNWKGRKFHHRPEVEPIVKRCIDCNNKVYHHHLRCNNCWGEYQKTKIVTPIKLQQTYLNNTDVHK